MLRNIYFGSDSCIICLTDFGRNASIAKRTIDKNILKYFLFADRCVLKADFFKMKIKI